MREPFSDEALDTILEGGEIWGEDLEHLVHGYRACRDRHTAPIVCLCGSTKFLDVFSSAMLELTFRGIIILTIGTHRAIARHYADGLDEKKVDLDRLHRQKIDLADAVFVLNVGGYIGESTKSEIEYARTKGRPIFRFYDYVLIALRDHLPIDWDQAAREIRLAFFEG